MKMHLCTEQASQEPPVTNGASTTLMGHPSDELPMKLLFSQDIGNTRQDD